MNDQPGTPRKMSKMAIRLGAMAVTAIVLVAAAFVLHGRKTSVAVRAGAGPAAQQSAAGSLAALASRNTSAAGQVFQVAGHDNVSVEGGNSYAHVVYAPRVKMFDHDEVKSALMGVSSDGHGFVFQHASDKLRGLQAGDVFMVKGEMAAKVLGVVTDQDQTLVAVDQASLKDLVQSGQVKLDFPVRFTGPKQAARNDAPPFAATVWDLLEQPVYAQQIPVGTKISGWTIAKWNVVAAQNEADFDLVMVKSEAGFEAWVGMKGWIGNFDISSNLDMGSGSGSGMVSQLAAKASNLSGFAQFEWEIGKSTPGPWATEDKVKLPAGISIPLAPLLEGMPLTLDISSAVLIHPGLTGNNEYAHGAFNVSFHGSGNFESQSSGDTGGDGSLFTETKMTANDTISPIGPNAMLIAFCAPRIELRLDAMGPFKDMLGSLGGVVDKVYNRLLGMLPPNVQNGIANSPLSKMTPSNVLKSNADVYLQFVVTGAVTHAAQESLFQCTRTDIIYTLQGGAAAAMFGLTDNAKVQKDLWTKHDFRYDPPTEACVKNSS